MEFCRNDPFIAMCCDHNLESNEFAEQRIAQIKEASSHLEAIVRQKDSLIGRLQKPFINDFLRVEASYQRLDSVFQQCLCL